MRIEDTYIYKSTDVAKYIVALANEKKISINMTKVQKLLYITYGAYLCVYGERLVDEHPQAWPYGPVFPTTRNKLLKQDLFAITQKEVSSELVEDEKVKMMIDFVFSEFGTWNAGQLSEWSHKKGSPWDKACRQRGFKWGGLIPDDTIKEYFGTIIIIGEQQK